MFSLGCLVTIIKDRILMSGVEDLAALAERYNVQEFYAFGSRADEIADLIH